MSEFINPNKKMYNLNDFKIIEQTCNILEFNDNILTAQLPDSELKELLATLLDQSSPHSMSFEDLPVEETMKSFFQNPQDYL